MNPTRSQELLGRLLEQELSGAEAEELARAMDADAALRKDVRQHLVLWELWSQCQAPERAPEAFFNACRTRLHGLNEDANEFPRAVREELEADPVQKQPEGRSAAGCRAPGQDISRAPFVSAGLSFLRKAIRPRARLAWAVCLGVLGLTGLMWLAAPRSAQALTTIKGEAVCTACVLHETQEHRPAIRVTGGNGGVYYLAQNHATAGLQPRFCAGPKPASAEGKATRQRGRLSFEAVSVTVADTSEFEQKAPRAISIGELPAIPDQEPEITRRIRALIQAAAEGRMQAEDYTVEFWREIVPGQQQIQADLNRVGELISMTLVERQEKEGRRHYRYRIEFRDATVLELFVLDAQNKVALIRSEGAEVKSDAR